MARGMKLPGNMQDMMKQAQKLQKDLEKAQEDAKSIEAEASSGGGMVTVVANGRNEILSLSISKEVIDPEDPEMLQDLVITAVNEALVGVQEKVGQAMKKVTGGLNIPGL